MKKAIAIVLTTLLLIPWCCLCMTASDFPFKDVYENDWFYADVKAAYELGLINGKGSSDTYKPDENMTYAEAIKLAACMHQKYTTGNVTLSNGEPWYKNYADYCKQNAIISHDYPYNLLVTRIHYIEIFASALPDNALNAINNVPDDSIPDIKMATLGSESVYKLYRAGILSGVDSEHTCNPTSNIKRSEVATILSRMMNDSKRVRFDISSDPQTDSIKNYELPEKKQWDNYTFGKEGDKTVAQQRQEILDAMNLCISTETVWEEVPEYNPTDEKYSHIKAITFDGLQYKGEKTKIFAYLGFPEGASAESPVPAIVLVHGGGGHAFYNWVQMWNERGYAAIAVDTVGAFPAHVNAGGGESGDKFGQWINNQLPDDFAQAGYRNSATGQSYTTTYAEVEDQWAYHALSEIILAGNILRNDPKVISEKVGITGISWGGTLVSQVIGYDNRFSFAIPVYGTAYLSNEMQTFTWFGYDYVDALWAAERNLSNATMPIMWLAYNDDSNFSIPGYCNSYMHTESLNDKNVLAMLDKWGHSHGLVWNNNQSFIFADWITFGKNQMVTFETQPSGREINCKINIPENVSDLKAYVYYINKPMSYSEFDKYGYGKYTYLDQKWFNLKTALTVDMNTGIIKGTLPDKVKGYYIDIQYNVDNTTVNTSSIYVPAE